ncbi:VanZ family protein [Bacillus safensis]|uniref:VanZ family protein n=1 Tax=Bacillus safensis TaxID=561879 RepID=UPI0022377323|nr:VanZ family protein [Bacillus safensis]MCW4645246.1 VanZ family protein [Bacillus safensis]MCY7564479.1 VanZ family protein [Bacillus safensis]MCY7625574.1 VanZ family protein [Bacillus safensis]MCY7634075.1 VanZ family protein [Bacillus safensis]MCY7647730.1 VanZ family protein [Bacillus safensis]
MTSSAMFSIAYFLLLVPLYLHMRYRKAKKHNRFIYLRTELVLACLFIYTNVLLYLTVFPNRFSAPRDQVSVNLLPLQSIYQNLHAYHHGYPNLVFLNLAGNILLFVPLGFFLYQAFRTMRWQKAVLGGFLLSTMIELLQWMFSQSGIITRSSDIDDILLNTLGTALGCIMQMYRKRKEKMK